MTRVGDTFIRQLKEKGKDFTNLYAFAELLESVDKDGVPDTKTLPVGFRKMKELGIKNAIIELDLTWTITRSSKSKISTDCSLRGWHGVVKGYPKIPGYSSTYATFHMEWQRHHSASLRWLGTFALFHQLNDHLV